jgi:hypothetical protein
MVLLQRCGWRGNNVFDNKKNGVAIQAIATMLSVANVSGATLLIVACTTSCYEGRHGNYLYCHDHEDCNNILLPC